MSKERINELIREMKKMSLIDRPNKLQGNYSDRINQELHMLLNERERKELQAEGWSPMEIIMYQRHSDLAIEEYKESKANIKKFINKLTSDANKLTIDTSINSKLSLYRSAFIAWTIEDQPYNEDLLKQRHYTEALETIDKSIHELIDAVPSDPWFQSNLRHQWAKLNLPGFKIPEVVNYVYTRMLGMLDMDRAKLDEIISEDAITLCDLGEHLLILGE